ncbi:hypothetical protein Acsp05_06630 [Actinokineospora sp. NBRC 105648]|nr:hypothetical protein Acsp05_06630 [Actinokineospora sp. NBRC 105648]
MSTMPARAHRARGGRHRQPPDPGQHRRPSRDPEQTPSINVLRHNESLLYNESRSDFYTFPITTRPDTTR